MKLHYSDWIIGIIINIENENPRKEECFLISFKFTKNTFYKKIINIINVIIFGITVFISLIGHFQISIENVFLKNIFRIIGFKVLFLNLILMIPGNINILISCLSTFYKFSLEKKHREKNLSILNPYKISYMDQISHLILDGNIAINPIKTKIHSLYFPNEQKNFYLLSQQLPEKIRMNSTDIEIIPQERKSFEDNFKVPYDFNLKNKTVPHHKYECSENLCLNLNTENQKLKTPKSPAFLDSPSRRRKEKSKIINFKLHNSMREDKYFEVFEEGNQSLFLKNTDILRGLLLCHEIRSKIDNEACFNEYGSPDTQTILSFLSSFGYELKSQCTVFDKFITCYNVTKKKTPEQYYIIAKLLEKIGDNQTQYKLSMIINDSLSFNNQLNNKCDPFLLIRTDDPSFIDNIDMDENERENLWLKIEALKSKGMRFIFLYQHKNINPYDLNEYIQYMKNPQSQEFKEIQKKMESKCELLTVLSIKDQISKKIKNLISDFITIENKIWIVSNDSKEKTVAIASSLGLLPHDIENIELEVSLDNFTTNEVWMQINSALKKLKKILNFGNTKNNEELLTPSPKLKGRKPIINFDSKIIENNNIVGNGKFNLILNGKLLSLIKDNDDLKNHFSFISAFCQNFIGFNLTSYDKEFLIELIKAKFPYQSTVLALGYSKEDSLMMKKADISIEYTKEQKGSSLNGDFTTNNFDIIRNLIRVDSLIFNEKIVTIMMICYSVAFLTCMPYFLYSVIFNFLPSDFIPKSFFILKDGLLFNIIAFIFFVWGESFNVKILKTFAWAYKSGKQIKDFFFREAFFRFFLSSLFDTFFLTGFIVYGATSIDEGNLFLFEQLIIIFIISINLMMLQKFTFFFKSPHLILFVLLLIAFAFYLFIALIFESTKTAHLAIDFSIFTISWKLLSNFKIFSFFLFVLFYQAIKSFFNRQLHHFYIGNYEKIKKALNLEKDISEINENFSNFNKNDYYEFNTKNVENAIKCIFGNQFIDASVQESNFYNIYNIILILVLNYNEIYVNERSYNRLTLNFKDKHLQSNYLITRQKDYIEKKIKITKLILLQNTFLIILNFSLNLENYELEDNCYYLLMIWIFFSIYNFFIALHVLVLKYQNVEKYYILIQNFMICLSLFLYILILIEIIGQIDANYPSLIVFFQICNAILFYSEYFDSFIYFTLYCLILTLFLYLM